MRNLNKPKATKLLSCVLFCTWLIPIFCLIAFKCSKYDKLTTCVVFFSLVLSQVFVSHSHSSFLHVRHISLHLFYLNSHLIFVFQLCMYATYTHRSLLLLFSTGFGYIHNKEKPLNQLCLSDPMHSLVCGRYLQCYTFRDTW